MLAKLGGVICFIVALASAGCAQKVEMPASLSPSSPPILTPFVTRIAAATVAATVELRPTPLPSPTPTPRVHVVKAGEDLGGIAYLYKVSLQSLLGLNPDVEPRAISVGTQLLIPPSLEQPAEETLLPAPTGVSLDSVVCRSGGEHDAWCFVEAISADQAVENVTAVIRIKLEGEQEVRSVVAAAPLDRIPANSSIPLAARLPFPVGGAYQASAELNTALPVVDEADRYLHVMVENIGVSISPDGLSAAVKGDVINQDEKEAALMRVVLVAHDDRNMIIGLRIWESRSGLKGGQSVAFQEIVYPVGGRIAKVRVLVEAKP